MDETAIEQEMAENRKAWERLREEIRRDYSGRFVALAFGRLIGVAGTYGDAVALVQQLEPVPKSFEVFLANDEPLFDMILDRYTEYL